MTHVWIFLTNIYIYIYIYIYINIMSANLCTVILSLTLMNNVSLKENPPLQATLMLEHVFKKCWNLKKDSPYFDYILIQYKHCCFIPGCLCFRSTPDIASLHPSFTLREARPQPHPHNSVGQQPAADSPGVRRESLPQPFSEYSVKVHPQVASCPMSPVKKDPGLVEKIKLEQTKTVPALLGQSTDSPKPKRTLFEGFKNTLRSKSKQNEDKERKAGGATGGSPRKVADSDCVPLGGAANLLKEPPSGLECDLLEEDSALEPHVQSMPDLVQDSKNADSMPFTQHCMSAPSSGNAEFHHELSWSRTPGGAVGGSATLDSEVRRRANKQHNLEPMESVAPVRTTIHIAHFTV